MSVFRSMKRVWETLTLRDKAYNYFPCGLAKRQEEVLPFGNTLLYFLIFIQKFRNLEIFSKIKQKIQRTDYKF